MSAIDVRRRELLTARGLRLEYATLGWNVVEIGFLVAAAIAAAAGIHPEPSRLGIAWLAATVAAMFGLAWGKQRTGRELGNPVLLVESKVTVVDGALAASILVGLLLNAVLGWWWADVVAGVLLVVYGLREGREHLRAGREGHRARTA